MKKLFGLVMGAGAVAMAQAPPTVVTRERIEIRHTGAMPMDAFSFSSEAGMSVEMSLVKGAPFAGEFVTESVQRLADGNRIVSKRTEVYARDGEGRTRREMGPVTFIHDPVAKVEWVLETQKKTARKMMMPDMGSGAGSGKNVMIFGGEGLSAMPLAGLTAGKFETKTEPLGKRMMSEETTYKLTNLRKGEPSRKLFEMPSDYTIETENMVGPMIHRMRIEKKND